MKRLVILGAAGSVGRQALDVLLEYGVGRLALTDLTPPRARRSTATSCPGRRDSPCCARSER